MPALCSSAFPAPVARSSASPPSPCFTPASTCSGLPSLESDNIANRAFQNEFVASMRKPAEMHDRFFIAMHDALSIRSFRNASRQPLGKTPSQSCISEFFSCPMAKSSRYTRLRPLDSTRYARLRPSDTAPVALRRVRPQRASSFSCKSRLITSTSCACRARFLRA